MRVIGGRFGGRRLRAPAGRATRPTSDRVREAVFALLGSVEDARVLDLFAGSGALGVEALSRGAKRAVFVEQAGAALAALRDNVAALELGPSEASIRSGDFRAALRAARAGGETFDLVLLDPPYARAGDLAEPLNHGLISVLAPGARVVCETDRRSPLELGLPLSLERRYGDTLIRIHQLD
jgi:16S rRNA (guanine966-N2)-methyltransferase